MKRLISVLTVFLMLSTLLVSSAVRAQTGPAVSDNSYKVSFPLSIDFSLTAEGGSDISDILLHYNTERESFASVTAEAYVDFQPAKKVNVDWTLDMRKTGGLPPGAALNYWWTVTDAGGEKTTTPVTTIHFEDGRYKWQHLTDQNITIYWYQGNATFAQELMDASNQALTRLKQDTGAQLMKPVEMYIYANSNDLQGAMIFPQDWTGGVAYSGYSTIAIGINQGNISWGKTAIAHELTHLVVGQMTENPYSGLPTWLEEGLAMYSEGPLDVQFTQPLNRAIDNNTLITVRSLSSQFSAYANESILSYAESFSIVEYLVTTFGEDKMLQMLNTFKQGSTYDNALMTVYGFDMDGLNTRWREYVYQKAGKSTGQTASNEQEKGILVAGAAR